ncbi:glycosyltransferase family 2 protein [Paraglaciecola arctica]|uniref:glycosyltransferase family 2 protein n=1 Tax=Paraglaciecola arctica TaxID=1128911 RepID=UPI001C07CAAC|nr:glycosyltransferase family 2 protein [Paraglaciecola arctica]MBU3005736.1 glycosyltransferase family 2 protein [Paraglaciecola arctica]
MTICILLATYNGGTYLNEQLDSLINQSEKNWLCLIRDDNSKDNTLEVIKSYCKEDPRFYLVEDELGGQGNAMANFAVLMKEGLKSKANYFFFCDQDDVWLPNKIETMVCELNKHDKDNAFLVHHDLEVVDEKLSQIAPSFINYSRLDSDASFSRLLGRNTVTGCASACNRKLLELSLPVPEEAMMHDWWLALMASYLDELYFVNQVLGKYRQHSNNVLGAKPFQLNVNFLKMSPKSFQKNLSTFHTTILQARALSMLISKNNFSANSNFVKLQTYSEILTLSKYSRLKAALKFGFFQKYWLSKVVSFVKFSIYSSKYHDVKPISESTKK